MKILKNSIIKILSIILLVIGGSVFIMALPKFFSIILTKIFDAIPTEPMYDADGKIIYQDDRHTIASFGKRKEFDIWKNGSKGEVSWILFDRDKNKEIDRIDRYTLSPSKLIVYTIGEKGYTKLNSETAEVIQSKDINLFSEEDIKIFKELESGKGGIKHQK